MILDFYEYTCPNKTKMLWYGIYNFIHVTINGIPKIYYRLFKIIILTDLIKLKKIDASLNYIFTHALKIFEL